eukprot:14244_1
MKPGKKKCMKINKFKKFIRNEFGVNVSSYPLAEITDTLLSRLIHDKNGPDNTDDLEAQRLAFPATSHFTGSRTSIRCLLLAMQRPSPDGSRCALCGVSLILADAHWKSPKHIEVCRSVLERCAYLKCTNSNKLRYRKLAEADIMSFRPNSGCLPCNVALSPESVSN